MRANFAGQMLARARNGEALFIEQALDFENRLDILAAIEAVAAGALDRLERGEFCLPESQHEGLGGRQAADFADAEQTLLGNRRRSLRSAGHVFSVS